MASLSCHSWSISILIQHWFSASNCYLQSTVQCPYKNMNCVRGSPLENPTTTSLGTCCIAVIAIVIIVTPKVRVPGFSLNALALFNWSYGSVLVRWWLESLLEYDMMPPSHSESALDPSTRVAIDLPTLLRGGLSSTHTTSLHSSFLGRDQRASFPGTKSNSPSVQCSTTCRHHGSSPIQHEFCEDKNIFWTRKLDMLCNSAKPLDSSLDVFHLWLLWYFCICCSYASWHSGWRTNMVAGLICILYSAPFEVVPYTEEPFFSSLVNTTSSTN